MSNIVFPVQCWSCLHLVTVAWSLQDTENNPHAQESGAQQPVDKVFFSNFHNDDTGQKFQTCKTDYSAVLNLGELLRVSCGLQLQFCSQHLSCFTLLSFSLEGVHLCRSL
jgi:hypothetical protein